MLKQNLFIATLFASFVSFAATPNIDGPATTSPIRVASFNISASYMGDTNAIRDAIKSIDADIIGIQEVDNKTLRSAKNFGAGGNNTPVDQADYLAKALNMNYVFCPAIEFNGGTYGHAILSKYPIKKIRQIKLPQFKGTEQRVACAVEVNVPNYPAPVIAISTQFDNTSPELQLKQIRAINKHFSAWQLEHGLPILIGDLSLTSRSGNYTELLELFNDTDYRSQELTAPSWNPDRKIDYILTSTAQSWIINNFTVPKPTDKIGDKPWHEISSHLPVIVDMKLTQK